MDRLDQEKTMDSRETLAALSEGMADAVARAGRSIVRVHGRRRRPGSGVVFAEDLVLTAGHVLEREEDLSVETADGRTLAARFVGRDHSSDPAALPGGGPGGRGGGRAGAGGAVRRQGPLVGPRGAAGRGARRRGGHAGRGRGEGGSDLARRREAWTRGGAGRRAGRAGRGRGEGGSDLARRREPWTRRGAAGHLRHRELGRGAGEDAAGGQAPAGHTDRRPAPPAPLGPLPRG